MLDVSRKLEKFTTSSPRISRNVRGGVYRSRFLRDLCLSDEVSLFLSDIAGISLSPHTIPHQLGHINFNPLELEKNVDKWHVDTLTFDYVLFVTDPKKNDGGEFQYLKDFRNADKNEMNFEGVDKLLTGSIAPRILTMKPGTLVLFRGRNSIHRVTPTIGDTKRILVVLAYNSEPRIALSESARKTFYGRLS